MTYVGNKEMILGSKPLLHPYLLQRVSPFVIWQHTEPNTKLVEAHHQYLRTDFIIWENQPQWCSGYVIG